MSNSDNALRAPDTFAGQINAALGKCLDSEEKVVLCGQLIKHGFAGCTTGLYEKHPDKFITYPVSEALMNSSAMGLALAGYRPVVFHVRMDFLLCGMDALFNHIPIWNIKMGRMPITFICQVGKGMGQGAQHSKDLSSWFRHFEGWKIAVPETPEEAYLKLKDAVFGHRPTMYVIHRELFDSNQPKSIVPMVDVRLCGASRRHEEAFYAE